MWSVLAVAVLMSLPDGGGKYGRWIEDLGHDDPAVRDAASLHLRAAGRGAWVELEAAAASHPDLEIRSRCRDLVASSRLRRRLPWRVLDEFPTAVATLQNGPSADRIALIRILARSYEDTVDLLLDLSRDPDPEVALAAAEYLQERRNTEWVPHLLEIYAFEEFPRAGRAYELLTMGAGRISNAELHRLFLEAGPQGRSRILQLALNATLPLPITPEYLRGLLTSVDGSAQRLALSWIRERGCPAALPFVESLLSDADPAVVADALLTLRGCGWRPASASIEALMAHDEASVREEAIRASLAFGEQTCMTSLRRLLDDPSMSVRQSAINALSSLGGTGALEDLWRVFLRDSGESRDTAASLLARAREWSLARLRPLIQDDQFERRLRGYDLWARIENVRVLTPLAKDREETVRRWALQEVTRQHDTPGAIDILELFAADPNESIRFEALRALVRYDRPVHAVELESFLGNKEYSFRFDAAETLLTLKDDRARSLARKLLEESDGPLRRLGYFALADRADFQSADRALRELNDPDGRLGGAAAKYLRQILCDRHDPGLLGRLAQGLEAWTGESLELAFNLLMEYGDRASSSAIRRLILTGRAPRPDRAIRALAEWAGEQAGAELSGLLGQEPALNESVFTRLREVRRRYPEAGRHEIESALGRLFASPDRRIRAAAVQAASDLNLPVEGIVALANDAEPSVRCAAICAARLLSLYAAVETIEERLDDDDPDVRVAASLALVALKPPARPKVERAAATEDCTWVRRKMEAALATQAR